MRSIVRLVAIISTVLAYFAAFEATGLVWVGIVSGGVVMIAIAWWWRRLPSSQPVFIASPNPEAAHLVSGWHDYPEGHGRYQAYWNGERWTKTRRVPRPTWIRLLGSVVWALLFASVVGVVAFGLVAVSIEEQGVATRDDVWVLVMLSVASVSLGLATLVLLVRRAAGIRRLRSPQVVRRTTSG